MTRGLFYAAVVVNTAAVLYFGAEAGLGWIGASLLLVMFHVEPSKKSSDLGDLKKEIDGLKADVSRINLSKGLR